MRTRSTNAAMVLFTALAPGAVGCESESSNSTTPGTTGDAEAEAGKGAAVAAGTDPTAPWKDGVKVSDGCWFPVLSAAHAGQLLVVVVDADRSRGQIDAVLALPVRRVAAVCLGRRSPRGRREREGLRGRVADVPHDPQIERPAARDMEPALRGNTRVAAAPSSLNDSS